VQRYRGVAQHPELEPSAQPLGLLGLAQRDQATAVGPIPADRPGLVHPAW
jgi:hypothetical protein